MTSLAISCFYKAALPRSRCLKEVVQCEIDDHKVEVIPEASTLCKAWQNSLAGPSSSFFAIRSEDKFVQTWITTASLARLGRFLLVSRRTRAYQQYLIWPEGRQHHGTRSNGR